MSMFLPDAKPQEREPAKGPEAYLSPDERKALQRSLSFPEDLPPKFKSWMIDFIAVNIPQIPISQIVGFTKFTPVYNLLVNTFGVGSTTYSEYGGPEIQVGKGTHLLLYGFQFVENTGSTWGQGYVSPSVNGATPADADAVRTKILFGGVPANEDDTEGSCVFFKIATLSEPNNTVRMKYRVTDGALTYSNCWVMALKVS
jgi:hypothetical protein